MTGWSGRWLIRPKDPDARITRAYRDETLILETVFTTADGEIHAVKDVSLAVQPGECVGVVGESGSGKSQLFLAATGLLAGNGRTTGSVLYRGEQLIGAPAARLNQIRGAKVTMIFQDPLTSLTPHMRIGEQIIETLRVHRGMSRDAAASRALEVLELVRIPEARRRMRQYPHELSGGLRQRAMIALALSCRPKLLLADEPTTALDATVQIQVLILLRELQKELGTSVIFVTHDLGVAAQVADTIAVMYAGRIVEYGRARDVLLAPRHPYTIGMLASTVHGEMRDRDIEAIPGSPPDLRRLPSGCSFAPRCRHALAACSAGVPPPAAVGPDHVAACIKAGALAPANPQAALV